jgi:hypothetical protein
VGTINSNRFIKFLVLFCLVSFQANSAFAEDNDYEEAVSRWASYEDVAKWLENNFVYDKDRLNVVINRTRSSGPSGLLARNPGVTYEQKRGYCTDSANFARHALNRINPAYKAQFVFIKNLYGQPHHWVTGFVVDGKIMVMDYGAGPEWEVMKGIHGPYDSLEQYAEYLRSLNIRRFTPELVEWRPNFPGQED